MVNLSSPRDPYFINMAMVAIISDKISFFHPRLVFFSLLSVFNWDIFIGYISLNSDVVQR